MCAAYMLHIFKGKLCLITGLHGRSTNTARPEDSDYDCDTTCTAYLNRPPLAATRGNQPST